jgi:hypothetical protein
MSLEERASSNRSDDRLGSRGYDRSGVNPYLQRVQVRCSPIFDAPMASSIAADATASTTATILFHANTLMSYVRMYNA